MKRTFFNCNITLKLILSTIILITSTSMLRAQTLKYNGDVAAGVVTTAHFSDAQITVGTTHGAYFTKPKLFVGAGALVGFNINPELIDQIIPVYGDIRKDFPIGGRFSTFIDAKIGYTLVGSRTAVRNDGGLDYGFYFCPTTGIRFATSDRCGLMVNIGYTYQNATYNYTTEPFIGKRRYNVGGFTASVGFYF